MSRMSITGDRVSRAVLAVLCPPGDRSINARIRRDGAAETVRNILNGDPAAAHIAQQARARIGDCDAAGLAEVVVEQTQRCSADIMVPGDAEWPQQLTDLDSAALEVDFGGTPYCLWRRGRGSLDNSPSQTVTITGARASTPYGNHAATEIAFGLSTRGWTTVSGGTIGIDDAGARGSLWGGGGTAIVLPCGIDQTHRTPSGDLLERVAETGVLVSEYPPGAVPQRQRFLERARLLAVISAGTVIVEAALRSQARFTAQIASTIGRAVMIVPGPITSAVSHGAHQLARDLPGARLVASASDIIADLTKTDNR